MEPNVSVVELSIGLTKLINYEKVNIIFQDKILRMGYLDQDCYYFGMLVRMIILVTNCLVRFINNFNILSPEQVAVVFLEQFYDHCTLSVVFQAFFITLSRSYKYHSIRIHLREFDFVNIDIYKNKK